MDRDHFSIEVSQATEETLKTLFQVRNVPDELNEAYRRSFPAIAEESSLHEHYEEMLDRGSDSVIGFVSNLKGKVAELETVSHLEEQNPGWSFELAEDPTQSVWDILGTGPDGTERLFQVKAGGQDHTDNVVQAMEEHANVPFVVSSELYARIAESHPELVERLDDLGSGAELTGDVTGGLDKLAGNMGIDLPDSIGGALPFVAEVVLGINLVSRIVSTERQLLDVQLSERSRVHGIRTLALISRFGINQVCMLAGGAAGAAIGSIVPGAGAIVGGLGGGLVGIGGGILLNRQLQPRIEEIAVKLIGSYDYVFYLMNKVEIDELVQSFAKTQVA